MLSSTSWTNPLTACSVWPTSLQTLPSSPSESSRSVQRRSAAIPPPPHPREWATQIRQRTRHSVIMITLLMFAFRATSVARVLMSQIFCRSNIIFYHGFVRMLPEVLRALLTCDQTVEANIVKHRSSSSSPTSSSQAHPVRFFLVLLLALGWAVSCPDTLTMLCTCRISPAPRSGCRWSCTCV